MVNYIKDDILEVMEITGLDFEKAEKLFKSVVKDVDDGTDSELCSFDIIDIIKTEHKVKLNGTDKFYAQSDKPKKDSKPRTFVVSDEKQRLFQDIFSNLAEIYGESAKIEKENKLIFVKIDEKVFKIDLIEQRKPKK